MSSPRSLFVIEGLSSRTSSTAAELAPQPEASEKETMDVVCQDPTDENKEPNIDLTKYNPHLRNRFSSASQDGFVSAPDDDEDWNDLTY